MRDTTHRTPRPKRVDRDTLVEHLVARSDGLSNADLAFVCQSGDQALALDDFDVALRESAL